MRLKPFNIHAFNVTAVVFLLIGLGASLSFNRHFLNPLSHRLEDYDITDIVYSQLRDPHVDLDERIVLVNTGRPDRARIAHILERLLDAGPAVVGVDILFPDRQDPATDSLLASVLQRGGSTLVMADALGPYHDPSGAFTNMPATDPYFLQGCRTGFINFPGNATRTVRHFSPEEKGPHGPIKAFAVEMAGVYDPGARAYLMEERNHPQRIHYSAGESHFIRLNPDQVLDTTLDLTGLVSGKMVILGYTGTGEWNDPMLDRHYTPMNPHYTGKSPPDMFGMVIHANIIRMILDRKYIREVPAWISLLIAFLLCYLNVLIPMWIHSAYYPVYYLGSRVMQLVQLGLIFFVVAWMYDRFLLKWDFSEGILALALVVDAQVIYVALQQQKLFNREWRKKPGTSGEATK